MRILHVADKSVSNPGPAASAQHVDPLENSAKAILKKMNALEGRIKALEARRLLDVPTPPSEVRSAAQALVNIAAKPEPEPVTPKPEIKDVAPAVQPAVASSPAAPPADTVSLNADVIKKDLFSKMWKYLNDKPA